MDILFHGKTVEQLLVVEAAVLGVEKDFQGCSCFVEGSHQRGHVALLLAG